MTSLDSLGIPYSETSAYKKAVATEKLKHMAASRAGLSDNEKAYFDFQHHDEMAALATTAGYTVTSDDSPRASTTTPRSRRRKPSTNACTH